MTEQSQTGADALEDVLAQYVAGQLAPASHALIAAHLALKPRNRAFVRLLEEAAAARMDSDLPSSAAPERTDLAAIFASPQAVAVPARDAQSDIPAALLRLINSGPGTPGAALPWRRYLPGIRRVPVSQHSGGGEANFYLISAGRRLPAHTHAGSEMTLVLRGSFSDQSGHYARGDIAFADADVDHKPLADVQEDCLCFAVTDAPLRLTGPLGRVVQRLFGGQA